MSVYVVKDGKVFDAFSGKAIDPFGTLSEKSPKNPYRTAGTPKEVTKIKASYTGQYLKNIL